MDKISIVMPSYNSELYIEEAINSVINQSYTNWELLIVDDGSTDSTGKIIDSYSLKDNRIKVFHTSNYGVSHARNIALDNATGEWITFLDSDDFLPNDALENLINNSKDSNFIVGNCEYIPESHNHYRIAKNERYENLIDLKDSFIDLFRTGFFSANWGKLIKKSVIDFCFDENYQNGEDTLFFSILLQKIKGIKLIENTVYIYRLNNNDSITHQINLKSIDVIEIVSKSYINYFNDEKIVTELKHLYLRKLVNQFNKLFKMSNKNDDEIKEIILSFLNNSFFKSITFDHFQFPSDIQRKAFILLIGDINLIMNEFKKNHYDF